MQVVYQLWEGSWEDGAVLRDREGRRIRRSGAHPSACSTKASTTRSMRSICPSRRRSARRCCTRPARRRAGASSPPHTPSASSSTASSATTCATSSPTSARGRRRSAAIRTTSRCSSAPPWWSRRPTPRRRTSWRNIAHYASSEGALAHYSASVGVDFSRYGPMNRSASSRPTRMRSNLEAITVRSRDTEWTPRKLLEMMVLGSRQAPIVGSPHARRGRAAGLGGRGRCRRLQPVAHGDPRMRRGLRGLVVPELQSRGVMKQEYAPGTLRAEAVRRRPARLPASHPAAALPALNFLDDAVS